MKAFVYFFVEEDHFKIGKSINVAMRSKQVAPNLIPEKSWAISFDKEYDAFRCEKSLHWMFRKYRLPKMDRDGGTEFFDINHLDEVIDLVLISQELFLYSSVINGENFSKEEGSIVNYGQWSLVHLPSGRWGAVWTECFEVDDMREAIFNEDPEWFHAEPILNRPEGNPSYEKKDEALEKIIKRIEGATQSDRGNLEEYNKPYLKRARTDLKILRRGSRVTRVSLMG